MPETQLDTQANRKSVKYTFRENLNRILWAVVMPLFRFSPRPFFGWRRFLLRLFGAKVGQGVNIYSSAVITMPWNLEIGDWSAIGENALIYNLGKITIGKRVTISQRVHLCAGNHDYLDPLMPLIKPPITIGSQAWLCADSFVGPDVTVGEGAIAGARAVVIRAVAPWSVVAGNPAKFIKHRLLRQPGCNREKSENEHD